MERIEIPKRMESQFKTLVDCLKTLTRPENMVLAGGTTLEMLWKHRDSTDIDLFVSNRTLIEISQAGKETKTRAETRIQRVGTTVPEEDTVSGPASCIKFRLIHAFTARNTGLSGRSSVWLMFTASEDRPHAVFLNLVQNHTESVVKRI